MSAEWSDLRLLLAVHREGSFLAAGKKLGVATSTVARRIEALETALGRRLVLRGNDGTGVDPDARELLSIAEQLEHGLAAMRRDVRDEGVSGVVRISVSEGLVVATTRVLAALRAGHPKLELELVSESRNADLARREADIAIRAVRSTSPVLIEKPMGKARIALFAARGYVERRLPSARLPRASAGEHDFVGFHAALDHVPQQAWMLAYGARRFSFRSSSSTAIDVAVEAGMGIGALGQAQVHTLADVVQIEADETPPSMPVFLVFHRDARSTPRIRLVVRALEAALRTALK